MTFLSELIRCYAFFAMYLIVIYSIVMFSIVRIHFLTIVFLYRLQELIPVLTKLIQHVVISKFNLCDYNWCSPTTCRGRCLHNCFKNHYSSNWKSENTAANLAPSLNKWNHRQVVCCAERYNICWLDFVSVWYCSGKVNDDVGKKRGSLKVLLTAAVKYTD